MLSGMHCHNNMYLSTIACCKEVLAIPKISRTSSEFARFSQGIHALLSPQGHAILALHILGVLSMYVYLYVNKHTC